MGLSHEHAGEHDEAQLPYGNNAVSGHLPSVQWDTWVPYFTYLAGEDVNALYPDSKHEGPSLSVAPSGGYVQHPQDINHGVAGGSGAFSTHAYPDMAQTNYHSYTLQNVERPSIYESGQNVKPFPSASGSSSKWQVPAPPAALGDSPTAFEEENERRTSLLMELKSKDYVGPYPFPSLDAEQRLLLKRIDSLFSDEYLGKLKKMGRNGLFLLSDDNLDQWLQRVLGVRQQLRLNADKWAPKVLYKLTKEEMGKQLISASTSKQVSRDGRGTFENIHAVFGKFDAGRFTFKLNTNNLEPTTGEFNYLAYENVDKDRRVIYFGKLVLVEDRSNVPDEKGKEVKRGKSGMRERDKSKLKIMYP
ncbi:hypothetical protein ACQY0O_006587 [Thecaphora frezii]